MECDFAGEIVLTADTGDGADRVRAPTYAFPGAVFRLGPGDDAGDGAGMSGGDGDDRLTGGFGLAGGAGNDTLTLDGPDSGDAAGGPGDDRVTGSMFDDRLDGGGGRDEVIGRSGDDEIADGDRPGAVDGDLLDGGEGVDVVSYLARTAPLVVDLGRQESAGEPGEGDRLAGFE
ncbi:MAG TPA: hypothetical protein VGR12_04945, partial [Solirubrobacteraceae bacterium]|nr:hypothetical protein [Solirubrobacteraceae bacterium]